MLDYLIGDFSLINPPVTIPSGVPEACFHVVAIDDKIVEDREVFTLMVETTNTYDDVDINMTIIILDNDSKELILVYIFCIPAIIFNVYSVM